MNKEMNLLLYRIRNNVRSILWFKEQINLTEVATELAEELDRLDQLLSDKERGNWYVSAFPSDWTPYCYVGRDDD